MQYIITDIAEELGLYEKGLVPSTPGSAGIDLYVAESRPVTIHPNVPTEIRTGLHLWTGDSNIAVFLMPRSSSKFRLTNSIGLIDSDYQGEYIVKALSNNDDLVTLQPGEKFAQIVFMHIVAPSQIRFMQVDDFSERTSRGTGRHGSTGK